MLNKSPRPLPFSSMQSGSGSGQPLRFRDEWRDFLHFLRKPTLTPRLPGARLGQGWRADWLAGLSPLRLLQWALLLWGCNLLFLGPIAAVATHLGGAQHRLLNMASIPWLHALLWAPLVEELLFRYGLRRPMQALWVVPAAAVALIYGIPWAASALLPALVVWLQIRKRAMPWLWRKTWRRAFGWVFYGASTLFALMHLLNFTLHQTPLWLLPLLVLPQWCTGLVLGWLRVRHGIGASMLLHALFNGGPLLLVWLLLGSGGIHSG